MKNSLIAILFLIGLILNGCSSSNIGLDGEKPPEAMIKVGITLMVLS